MKRTILHCDANNFYASVEAMLDPTLKDKPLAVSGNPDKRHGIILAKSEQAKKAGIKTGETIWQAKQKCPELILRPPNYSEYVRVSDELFKIYTNYTDRVEPFGIDECWLDCTGSLRLFGSGLRIADELRARVKKELNITISVGVSFSKIFAKLGSDIKKPDATTLIDENNYREIAWKLPVTDLLMVGRKTRALFEKLNITTIGDLACYDEKILSFYMGINGVKLRAYANGEENEDIRYYYNSHIPKSIGNSTTTPIDVTDLSQATAVIVGLSEMVATRLRKHHLIANGVSLWVKYNNLQSFVRNKAIPFPTANADQIADYALEILSGAYTFGKDLPIRALGVSTYKLDNEDSATQLPLFGVEENIKHDKLEKSVDNLRGKYGYNILRKGITMAHNELTEDLVDDDFLPFKK